ncbi:ripening-related protein grip22-like [Macadamia integrifolia]|uniref:ripening-related protein grip22-like n=1 Tax=Macadamia integrifolia TaxID=60698 RepID=UPI001C4FFBD3|nr:ripening-related protein grip22-like [Macadamia integrifolia]
MALTLLAPLSIILLLLPYLTSAISSCGGSCNTLDDCSGQLICINGKCNDDPDLGTHICSNNPPPSPGGGSSGGDGCSPAGKLRCGSKTYTTYNCSAQVTSSTPAQLTNNNFEAGGDGGGASECDGKYHSNSERIVALSTGWYAGGSRCGKMIKITANNGKTTTAKVVDECDSMHGCDKEHDYQPPCHNNIVDASNAVWNALGLDIGIGVVDVKWTMA